MKKKVLALILAVALVASVCCLLTACGEDAKTETAATAAPAATTAVNDNTDAGTGNANADTNSSQTGDTDTNDGDNGSEDNGSASSTPMATSAEYTGETVITFDQAVEFVFAKYSYGEGFTTEDGGAIAIPDGSVWHNVIITDENGEMVASYYVSDTTGTVMTTNELQAYAYN